MCHKFATLLRIANLRVANNIFSCSGILYLMSCKHVITQQENMYFTAVCKLLHLGLKHREII